MESYVGYINEYERNNVTVLFSVPKNEMNEDECIELLNDHANTYYANFRVTRSNIGRKNSFNVHCGTDKIAELKLQIVESII